MRRLILAGLLLALAGSLGVLGWHDSTLAGHSPPGPVLWGYQAASIGGLMGEYNILTHSGVSSCTPPGSLNGRGVAHEPSSGSLWYTFVTFPVPAFAGDGFIHETTPPPACAALSTIPFGDGPGGTVQDDIGALDLDPDDDTLWAAGYTPVAGVSMLYKVHKAAGQIFQSCGVNSGGGGVGNDTLAVANIPPPVLPGSGKYLLTDAGEIDTNQGGLHGKLLVIDAADCALVASYDKIVGMTGIDFQSGELIATDGYFIYDLGAPPFGAIEDTLPVDQSPVTPIDFLEDITLTGNMKIGGPPVVGGIAGLLDDSAPPAEEGQGSGGAPYAPIAAAAAGVAVALAASGWYVRRRWLR